MDVTRSIEEFHLLFLSQLARRVKPGLFVVKGGCNLRFFHGSVRCSEDLDLDLGEIGAGPFRDRVRELLASRPFLQILEARGVALDRVSEPKQTDTTQRWKVGLRVMGVAAPLPTKIECSRRGLENGVELGSVDPLVARGHRLPPFMVSHYAAATALRQKVGALAGRKEMQARDVFDLHHLLARGTAWSARNEGDQDRAEHACTNALLMNFATFVTSLGAWSSAE